MAAFSLYVPDKAFQVECSDEHHAEVTATQTVDDEVDGRADSDQDITDVGHNSSGSFQVLEVLECSGQ